MSLLNKLVIIISLIIVSCDQNPIELQNTQITLEGDYRTVVISAEIADEPSERAKGLMNRDSLGEDHGMLFIFPDESVHTFWMHNTHFSLDMIFIDSNGTIAGIIRRAAPDSDETLAVDKASKYVLEVEGGLCDRIGIGEGKRIELHARY
ncbi:MAG: hypothetical protein COS94_01030 [Candidatus Hydrogenedentes bacterium CG07_land_8_20_14_0_80_42_17]|nr:MAG: hypothetical protein COS94_01030 [Candidatus Hydrogenedentes bacterium CG07_land_8_20_14_0_80_42_17]